MGQPDDAQLSPDGNYWWDGGAWQPVTGGAADTSGAGTEDPGQHAPTDASSEAAQLAQVGDSEAHALAQQIAAAFGITQGHGVEQLNIGASDPEQMSGDDVRAQCAAKCDLSLTYDGEVFALTGCGDGTCPTCPPGFGNLIVRNWCAYTGVVSHRAVIVLHLAFGATVGPIPV